MKFDIKADFHKARLIRSTGSSAYALLQTNIRLTRQDRLFTKL